MDALALADYRSRVSQMYARIRQDLNPRAAWEQFCAERDLLFREHPCSALSEEQKAGFAGLSYYPYDPAYRLQAALEPLWDEEVVQIELGEDGLLQMKRAGRVSLKFGQQVANLTVFWLLGYGGGLFLPFADQTSGPSTYGGGRYLLDSIKGAYLGQAEGQLILDFNFAYNPSCAYNPRWVCPLAPLENRLPIKILAGEKFA